MKEHFEYILNNYAQAYKAKTTKHPISNLLTGVIPAEIKNLIIEKERYIIEGSAGAGNLASIPWIAIFDILITKNAQSGYYPVFVFKDDMSGFYLSLNQGVTILEKAYKRETKHVLKLRAEDFRAKIDLGHSNFSETIIKLKTSKNNKSKYPGLYEAGNIIAKYYPIDNVPTDEELSKDITDLLKIYSLINYNESISISNPEKENDEDRYKGYEELKKFRFHKRIERNVNLSKKVKKVQGYTCKACKFNFRKKYGALGEQFIEAHHLIPLSKLTGERIQLDIRKDFTVLCSNCHSMIHRLKDPSDLEALKKLIIKDK